MIPSALVVCILVAAEAFLGVWHLVPYIEFGSEGHAIGAGGMAIILWGLLLVPTLLGVVLGTRLLVRDLRAGAFLPASPQSLSLQLVSALISMGVLVVPLVVLSGMLGTI